MIKVLCLSFRTPPTIRPQAILIGKMIPEWLQQDLAPIIVAYERPGDWDVRAPLFFISQLKTNNFFFKLPVVRSIFREIYYYKVLSNIKKIIAQYQPDVIFSFSNPQESNIIGAKLKKQVHLPFVSHFSDPWSDNPYNKYSWFSRLKNLSQESQVIKNSDKIIFVNDQLRDLVMKKYPSSWMKKTEIVPHCFDAKDYPKEKKTNSAHLVFSYIGAFYKQRNPEIIFKAFNELLKKGKNKNNFKIQLVGGCNDYAGYPEEKIKQIAKQYGLEEKIEIIPTVSYQESLKYMKSVDCLIVIDADIAGSPFLPSKLIDYAGSGTPILGITPAGTPTAEFLVKMGYDYFNYQQVEGLIKYLEDFLAGKIHPKSNDDFLADFNVINTTKKMKKIFQETISENNNR